MDQLKDDRLTKKTPKALAYRQHKVQKYLNYQLKRKYKKGYKYQDKKEVDKRGVELTYAQIGHGTGLSYMQARRVIDKLVASGILEKWTVYTADKTQRNFYRWHKET